MLKSLNKFAYSLLAVIGLGLTNLTVGISCFIGMYEPELPEDEN